MTEAIFNWIPMIWIWKRMETGFAPQNVNTFFLHLFQPESTWMYICADLPLVLNANKCSEHTFAISRLLTSNWTSNIETIVLSNSGKFIRKSVSTVCWDILYICTRFPFWYAAWTSGATKLSQDSEICKSAMYAMHAHQRRLVQHFHWTYIYIFFYLFVCFLPWIHKYAANYHITFSFIYWKPICSDPDSTSFFSPSFRQYAEKSCLILHFIALSCQ